GFLDVVNRCDVGMIERCKDFSLALETAHARRVARKSIRQELDRDLAFELGIAGAVHFAHSALTEKSDDFERAKSCTYIYRHWNITEKAKLPCGVLCREATKEANSTEESTQVVDQSGFHAVIMRMPLQLAW